MSATESAVKPAAIRQLLKTVLFGAMGVRRRSDHEEETQPIHPAALVVAGLIAAVIFVLTLLLVVRLVLS